MIVHFMGYGHTACLMNGPPKDWPDGHKWESDWTYVTCPECLAGKELVHTFRIFEDGKKIQCLMCGLISSRPDDVQQQYCPGCKIFHDDLWPPARRAMIRKDFLEQTTSLPEKG